MRTDAFLCDSATVRENLLHILGGGITRVWKDEFPAPLGLCLAIMFTLHPTEAKEKHRLRVVIQGADGQQVAQLDGEFGVASVGPGLLPGEKLAMPMVLNLAYLAIPSAGLYSLELLVDLQLVHSVPFVADLRSNMPRPA